MCKLILALSAVLLGFDGDEGDRDKKTDPVAIRIEEPREQAIIGKAATIHLRGTVKTQGGAPAPQVVIIKLFDSKKAPRGRMALVRSEGGGGAEHDGYRKVSEGVYEFDVVIPSPGPGKYTIAAYGTIVKPAAPGTTTPTPRISAPKVTFEVRDDGE